MIDGDFENFAKLAKVLTPPENTLLGDFGGEADDKHQVLLHHPHLGQALAVHVVRQRRWRRLRLARHHRFHLGHRQKVRKLFLQKFDMILLGYDF